MKINISKSIGSANYTFTVENDKTIDALFEAGLLSLTPTSCSLCDSPDVELGSNKNKGYTFVYVRCSKCGAKANLGSYKDGGYFWKKFEQYQKESKENGSLPVVEE